MSEIKNNRNKLWVSFMLLAVVLGSGCSRPKNGDSSSISISLPKTLGEASFGSGGNGAFTASANSRLAVAIINVTGSGIVNPISFNAGGENSNGIAPTDFTMEIPSGSARLIQLLVVYEDPDSNQMFFYYGDVTKDLLGGSVNVEIPISEASTGDIFSGQVSGRYLTPGNDVGPTGHVDISIQPPDGKRPMVIETSSIVNGWFSFFMLAGVDFKYTVRESGLVMWGGPVNLDSTKIKPDSGDPVDFNKRFRVMIPWHKRENGEGTLETGDPRIYSWGFWAHPGAPTNISDKSVCSSIYANSSFQKLKQYNTETAALGLYFPVSPFPLITNFAGVISPPVSVPTDAKIYGGTGSTCNASPTYLNHLKVTLPDIDGTGSDEVATFRGIFTPHSASNYFNVTDTTTTPPEVPKKIISGTFLPGITSVIPGITSVIDGVRLFRRPDSSDDGMREINCAKIAALRDGFQQASSDNGTITGNTFTITSNITAAEGTNGVGVVICPMKDGKVLNFGGVYLKPKELGYVVGGGGSGGGTVLTADTFQIIGPQGSAGMGTIANNVCTPIIIKGLKNGSPAQFPAGLTLNATQTGAAFEVYEFSNCSSTTNTISNFSGNFRQLFVKRSTDGNGTLTLTAPGGVFGPASISLISQEPVAPIGFKIKIVTPTSINAHSCYPLQIQSWSDSATLMVGVAAFTNFSFPSTAGLVVYNSHDCTNTPTTTGNLTTGAFKNYSFKYSGSLTTFNLMPSNISPNTTTPLQAGNNISVNQPGPPSSLALMIPNQNVEALQCLPIEFSFLSANFVPTITTVAGAWNLSSTGTAAGSFYAENDISCGGIPIGSSLNYFDGEMGRRLRFKANSSGNANISVSSNFPALSKSVSINFSQATYSKIVIVPPGQSYSSSMISGSPTTLTSDTAANVTLYLVLNNGEVDINANGTGKLTELKFINGTSTAGMFDYPNTINFSSGFATAWIIPTASGTLTLSATGSKFGGGIVTGTSVPITVNP